jgi:hypothetical protein
MSAKLFEPLKLDKTIFDDDSAFLWVGYLMRLFQFPRTKKECLQKISNFENVKFEKKMLPCSSAMREENPGDRN